MCRRVWQLRHHWDALQQGEAEFARAQPVVPTASRTPVDAPSSDEDSLALPLDQQFRAELAEAKQNSK